MVVRERVAVDVEFAEMRQSLNETEVFKGCKI